MEISMNAGRHPPSLLSLESINEKRDNTTLIIIHMKIKTTKINLRALTKPRRDFIRCSTILQSGGPERKSINLSTN